ncbi:membrane protein [Streptomyces sp. NRRL F-2799]|uniref:membrane protein n=1 Tax=Streptomyces sp. NRRL F-2799 TaxID=1463844 RepID=UPI0004C9F07D|nr:membrane protein [Streptomyces sp. NRRL F-2799]
MGIESDQVVYEYLSRVGDVAQQRQLPSSTRMRLVSELRNEIDRHRARATVDSPAAVRRILDQLGSPDDVVRSAGGKGPAPHPPPTAVPAQPEPEKPERRPRGFKGLRAAVPRPRPAERGPSVPADAPSPPHLASADELGESLTRPDWWRVADGPFGAAAADSVPGFVGGVEIPEMLRRPPKETPKETPEEARPKEVVAEPVEVVPRSRFRRFVPLPSAGWTNPLLLLGAAALLAGAVLGNWYALLLGWLIAYGSRRLTPAETKWAVLVLPALALAAGVAYLWGRDTGHWGTPVAEGHMSDALTETWPWVVRGAAVSSALFLLWRSQRRR